MEIYLIELIFNVIRDLIVADIELKSHIKLHIIHCQSITFDVVVNVEAMHKYIQSQLGVCVFVCARMSYTLLFGDVFIYELDALVLLLLLLLFFVHRLLSLCFTSFN